jgi:hypothetical protein
MASVIAFYSSMGTEMEETTKRRLEVNQEPLEGGYLVRRYMADLEDSWIFKFMLNVERAAKGSHSFLTKNDSVTTRSSSPDEFEHTKANVWRDHEPTYSMDDFTYDDRGGSNLYDDLLQSTKNIFDKTFSPTHIRSKLTREALCDLDQQRSESSLPSLDEVSSEDDIADLEANMVHMLMGKLWIACQDPSSTCGPQDGAGHGSRDQQSSQESSQNKAGSQGSPNRISTQRSSKLGEKRPRQPPQTPESEEEGDDRQSKKSVQRGKRARMPNEFGCPFFKHDPVMYGGRGVCPTYSNPSVPNVLKVGDLAP